MMSDVTGRGKGKGALGPVRERLRLHVQVLWVTLGAERASTPTAGTGRVMPVLRHERNSGLHSAAQLTTRCIDNVKSNCEQSRITRLC